MSNELRISDWSTGVCSSDRPEGLAAALALWLAARDDRANPLAAPGADDANASEVSQFSADFGDEYESPETPEEAAAVMTVWFDDRAGDWRPSIATSVRREKVWQERKILEGAVT